MYTEGKIWVAEGESPVCILPQFANRHGLIAGATGTGKTITMKVMAESFSDAGVPVFLADIKGDLGGMVNPGTASDAVEKRIAKYGLLEKGFAYKAYPVSFWDVYGEKGHPVRTTISEMGPMLLSRIMGLNDTQQGVMDIVFHVADDNKLLLLDLKDLRAMLQYVSEHASEYTSTYGTITSQSIGAIQRALLLLEDQGGDQFFGEPALQIQDWIQTASDGRGFMNILYCEKLFQNPALYSTFLLWMLSELYDLMPEAGDIEKPKMVFFFDEAHLLFKDASKALLEKITQVVRLIRSKGVGIYFVTQSPTDIPDDILSQLGNRVQHALRAYTPAEQKKVKTAAETFRTNPAFDTLDVISSLDIGEALVSFLDEKGSPSIVQRAGILPPQSQMGPIDDTQRKSFVTMGALAQKYNTPVDRESAYELLQKRIPDEEAQQEVQQQPTAKVKGKSYFDTVMSGGQKEEAYPYEQEMKRRTSEKTTERPAKEKKKNNHVERIAMNTLSSMGREVGRQLVRGLFNSLKK